MTAFARQFSFPDGVAGRLVSQMLARGNGEFNRWLVSQLVGELTSPSTILEVGSGPGVALQELLNSFPHSRIVGVDPSPVVQRSARRRNAAAIEAGRITLIEGDIHEAGQFQPADLVLAVHVVYFWSDPVKELRQIREALTAGGTLALGYQLRSNMPGPSQRNFPKAGFTLFDADEEILDLMRAAGFAGGRVRVFGDDSRPRGRLALAVVS